MAINNDAYYNAAFMGALEGILEGRTITSSTATDYATQVNAADAFAQEIDSLIAEDALVSTGGGDASCLAGSTSTIVFNGRYRPMLMQACSRAYFAGRNFTDAVVADYAAAAAAVKAAWTQGLTKLTNAA